MLLLGTPELLGSDALGGEVQSEPREDDAGFLLYAPDAGWSLFSPWKAEIAWGSPFSALNVASHSRNITENLLSL